MTSVTRARDMRYGRENIERKIIDLQRMLATSDDQLEIALLKMAIESFESERDSLLPPVVQPMAEDTGNDNVGVAATKLPPLETG